MLGFVSHSKDGLTRMIWVERLESRPFGHWGTNDIIPMIFTPVDSFAFWLSRQRSRSDSDEDEEV
jgi:hypothetical protein